MTETGKRGNELRASDDCLNCCNTNYKMGRNINFKISLIVVEAIRGRCASFLIPTATVSAICGGQTNSLFYRYRLQHELMPVHDANPHTNGDIIG